MNQFLTRQKIRACLIELVSDQIQVDPQWLHDSTVPFLLEQHQAGLLELSNPAVGIAACGHHEDVCIAQGRSVFYVRN